MRAPRGVDERAEGLGRHPRRGPGRPAPDEDDLLALANAVREVGLAEEPAPAAPDESGVVELAHRGHLRVIADRRR